MVAHDITDATFLFAVDGTATTVLLGGSFDNVSHAGAEHRPTRQSRDGAMFRGGSFDRSGVSPRHREE